MNSTHNVTTLSRTTVRVDTVSALPSNEERPPIATNGPEITMRCAL